MRRATTLLAALGLSLVALLVGVGSAPAWAHASLIGSSPEQGARLDALPDEVVFEFSAAMNPLAYVVVTGPDGESVVAGDPVVDGATITQALAGNGADGGYLMAIKAVSADGHAVTGRVDFVVGAGELPPDTGTPDPSTGVPPAIEAGGSSTSADGKPRPGGHPLWVWAVGPLCLAGSLAMWFAARRSSVAGTPGS